MVVGPTVDVDPLPRVFGDSYASAIHVGIFPEKQLAEEEAKFFWRFDLAKQ